MIETLGRPDPVERRRLFMLDVIAFFLQKSLGVKEPQQFAEQFFKRDEKKSSHSDIWFEKEKVIDGKKYLFKVRRPCRSADSET